MPTVMEQAAGYFIAPRLHLKPLDAMIYYYLLAQANYRPTDTCQRGQAIVSQSRIAQEIGVHRMTIARVFERLRDHGLIVYQRLAKNRGLLVTINDYDAIQTMDFVQQVSNKRATSEHQVSRKCATSEQQTVHHEKHEIADVTSDYGNEKSLVEHHGEQQVSNKRATSVQQTSSKRATSEHSLTKELKTEELKTKEKESPNGYGAERAESNHNSPLDDTIPAKDYWKDREYIVDLVQTYRQMPKVTPQKDDYAFFGGLYKQYGYDAVLEAIERFGMLRRVVIIHDPREYIKGVLDKQSFERPKSWSELTLEQKRAIFQNRIGFQNVMSQ